MDRDVIADARRIGRRDPGFAVWLLVSQLRYPLRRAIRWAWKVYNT